jgi:uncharacterized protein (TIGR00369 family)
MASDAQAPGTLEQLAVLFCESIPHNRVLGLRVAEAADGVTALVLPYSPELVGNPETGVLAGGAVTSLIDSACGAAVLLKLGRLARVATLDLRIDYLRPALPGKDLVARAHCYKLTRSVAFVRAQAHQGDESDPVASAQGTFILTREGQAA